MHQRQSDRYFNNLKASKHHQELRNERNQLKQHPKIFQACSGNNIKKKEIIKTFSVRLRTYSSQFCSIPKTVSINNIINDCTDRDLKNLNQPTSWKTSHGQRRMKEKGKIWRGKSNLYKWLKKINKLWTKIPARKLVFFWVIFRYFIIFRFYVFKLVLFNFFHS